MSVRKRTWVTGKGVERAAFVVDYVDGAGGRHLKTFDKEKDAKAYHASVTVDVAKGVHVADSKSITVAAAGEQWLKTCQVGDGKLERSTLREYRRNLDTDIVPYLGREKLSKLTTPVVTAFRDKLLAGDPAPGGTVGRKRSAITVKKVIIALGALIADAQQRGQVAQNVVRNLKRESRKKATQRRRLEVGADIPTLAEVKAIVDAAEGRWRPLLMAAALTGLRASELRGLRWADVDIARAEVHVRQRADRFNEIGAPKSRAGERTVPLLPTVVSTLRIWRAACPPGPLGLVFPTGKTGRIENLGNIVQRGFYPAQIRAGVSTIVKDAQGKVVVDAAGEPVRKPKFSGFHSLRHFYASWCINRRADGGLELPAKVVQERLGHSSIVMTLDVYGHLFPRGDVTAELAAADRQFFG
jgi:integrase